MGFSAWPLAKESERTERQGPCFLASGYCPYPGPRVPGEPPRQGELPVSWQQTESKAYSRSCREDEEAVAPAADGGSREGAPQTCAPPALLSRPGCRPGTRQQVSRRDGPGPGQRQAGPPWRASRRARPWLRPGTGPRSLQHPPVSPPRAGRFHTLPGFPDERRFLRVIKPSPLGTMGPYPAVSFT